jgi:iron complex transport system substrate-binding protein
MRSRSRPKVGGRRCDVSSESRDISEEPSALSQPRADSFDRLFTRRQVVVSAALATGAALLAGCGSSGSSAGWEFIDDRGHAVRLSNRPTRIAAYVTSAAALQDWGVTPVGVFGEDPPDDPRLAGFPWGRSEIVGSVYGEIDTAKLLALQTQLIVSRWFPLPSNTPLFGFKDLGQQETIGAEVPIVGLRGNTIATAQIARFAVLARALGVELDAGEVKRAREAFERASARLSHVAERKSQLRIIAVAGDQSTMYVAKIAGDSGDLAFYRQRGVPLVSAETSDRYWDRLSWNHAGKYPADGILYDARPGNLPLADAKKIPGFAALPAVRANQVGAWRADPPPSYQSYTRTMDELAATIASWHPVA